MSLWSLTDRWRRSRGLSEAEILERQPGFLRACQEQHDLIRERSTARILSEYHQARPRYDLLVLSGGGSFGAFGAGLLQGWGEVQDPDWVRPEFDQVNGISTGALIAPFAFIGTDEAYTEIADFYANPGSDWVRKRGLLPYLPGNVSLYEVSKLREMIASRVTPELVRGIARGGEQNRLLVVGATNIAYGMLRIWELASYAQRATVEQTVETMTQVLHATCAIPGAFPPVTIDDFLYVDGGASMQTLISVNERDWVLAGEELYERKPELGHVHVRIWVIVNQKLLPTPRRVRKRWTSIASRSLDTLVRTSTLQSLQDAQMYAWLLNQREEFDAELHFVSIPQDYAIQASDDLFHAETMRDLVQLGRELGADPKSWSSDALRSVAPEPK